MATELATAYISLVPSFKGGQAAIAKELAPAEAMAAKSGGSSGAQFAGAMKSGLGVTAIFAGAGAGALAVGSDFNAAYKTIRVGTGETGAALKGLKGDFKAVLAVRPDNMKDVAAALTATAKATGLTGKPLQDLTKQYLQLAGATGTDLQGNIKQTGQLFQNWSVPTGQQADKLDLLFRASQKGKIGVAEIAAAMTKAGPVARQLGLDFDDTAGLVSMLSNAGIDIGEVMPAMSKTIKTAAKEGKDAGTVFRQTFKDIKNGKSDSDAAAIAVEAFGAKAGPKLAALIREGKLSYEDYTKAIAGGKDTIAGAAKDTGTMSGKLKTLKNSFLVAIEPLASGAFDSANKILAAMVPWIQKISTGAGNLPGPVKKATVAIVALGATVKVFGLLHKGVTKLISPFKSLGQAALKAKGFLTSTGADGYSKMDKLRLGFIRAKEAGSKLWSGIKSGASSLASYAKNAALAAVNVAKQTAAWVAQKAALIASKVATLAVAAAEKVMAVAQAALNFVMEANPIGVIVLAIGALVAGLVLAYQKVGWFHKLVDTVFHAIQAVVGGAVDFIKSHWQLLLAILTGPIGLAVLAVTKHFDTIKAIPGIVVDFIKSHWQLLLAILTGPIGLAVLAIKTHWQKISDGFTAVKNWIGARVGDIVGFVTGIPGRIGGVISTLWNGLKNGITAAKNWVGSRIGEVVEFVKGIAGRIAGAASTMWNAIKTGITTARDWVKARIGDLVGYVTGLPGRISSAARGLFDGIKSAFKSALNWIIDKWNSLSFTIPSVTAFGHTVGGQTFSVPHIPKFHTGGVIPGGFGQEVPILGLAGERVLSPAQSKAYDMGRSAGDGAEGNTFNHHYYGITDAQEASDMTDRTVSWRLSLRGRR